MRRLEATMKCCLEYFLYASYSIALLLENLCLSVCSYEDILGRRGAATGIEVGEGRLEADMTRLVNAPSQFSPTRRT